MCGISGIYNVDIDIQELLGAQISRGPDNQSYAYIQLHNQHRLVLGHNRLKIVDLNDRANQPFSEATTANYLTYNGEIYNYLALKQKLEPDVNLFTRSDTEVLFHYLQQQGMQALSQLNGMFAFAYFDHGSQTLYLARDRFGQKPLYYYHYNNSLVFASSAKQIAKSLSLSFDMGYIAHGVKTGIYEFDPSRTAYQNLSQVPPGAYISFRFEKGYIDSQLVHYYELDRRVQEKAAQFSGINFDEAKSELKFLIQNSVNLRLQADVPVAVSLSGGLDSASISYFAKQSSNAIEAFSFSHPEDLDSEGVSVNAIGSRLGLHVNYINPSKDEWVDALESTLIEQDGPFSSLSIVAQNILYKHVKQHGFKVLLGGQAADEILLGYRKFYLYYLKELVKSKKLQSYQVAISMLKMLGSQFFHAPSYFSDVKHKLRKNTISSIFEQNQLLENQLTKPLSVYDYQLADVFTNSLPTLLRYEDRNSMGHSIESRLPFMDYELVEFSMAMPTHYKLHNGYGKWILREVMKEHLPNSITHVRYKRGFDISRGAISSLKLWDYLYQKLQQEWHLLGDLLPLPSIEYFSPMKLNSNRYRIRELFCLLWLGARL